MQVVNPTNFYRVRRTLLILLGKRLGKILRIKLPPAPSVSALVVRGSSLLLVKLSYKDGYALPGGGIEPGESVEGALVRELKEETGLDVMQMKYYYSFYFNAEYPTINMVFIVTAKGRLRSSAEGDPEWINIKNGVPKMVYWDNQAAINRYFSR